MIDNIEKVLDRGEKLTLLVEKADSLQMNALKFKKTTKKVRKTEGQTFPRPSFLNRA